MTMLSIVRRVAGQLSLVQPLTVIGNTDKQVIQLYELLNEAGEELARDHNWQALIEEANFTTIVADAQPGAIPADFDRFLANSFFNRTTRRPMTGPISARQWQWIKAQPVYSTVYLAFRERTGEFLVAPQPAADNEIFYEYVSINWAKSAGGAPQALFEQDTDTSFLDETLLQKSLKWRFLRAKGLDYAEEFTTFERALEKEAARDGGNSMLSLAPQPVDLNRVNLPDGSFGV